MNIQAIVLDIDGTLLNTDRQITQKTKEALAKAQDAGIKILLASGRSTFGLVPFAKELNMQEHNGLIIANNGAMVTDATGETIHLNETIQPAAMQKLLQHIQNFNVHPMLMNHKNLHTINVDQAVVQTDNGPLNVVIAEGEDCGLEIIEHPHLDAFEEAITKITLAANAEELKETREDILAPIQNDISYAYTSPHFIEIMKKGVDKAHGLRGALKHFNLTLDQAIAFGDGDNDLALIQHAGIGVAMGNATKTVKKHADLITSTNDQNGIAEVLEQHILIHPPSSKMTQQVLMEKNGVLFKIKDK